MEAVSAGDIICKNCSSKLVLENKSVIEKIDKCTSWLESVNIEDCNESLCSESIVSSSEVSELTSATENSAMDSGLVFNDPGVVISNEIVCQSATNSAVDLQTVLSSKDKQSYESINVYKSKKVHIGDVTYINGPVYVNQYKPTVTNQLFITNNYPDPFPIVNRTNWLAQPPIRPYTYLKGPAKFVVIAHTATEEAYTQADNTLLVRLAQTFHIESRKWDDIAYNFMIGADGTVFEGRGWGVIGATAGIYNKHAIAISFVGCYMHHLPPPIAMKKARALIQHGVKIGTIAEDYALLGHCQCSSVESPGKTLYEEIKTWKNWDGSISVLNPSPIIMDSLPG